MLLYTFDNLTKHRLIFQVIFFIICWSLIANFHQNFGCQILLSLAMATKMVTGWSTGGCGRFAIERVNLLDDLKDASNTSFVFNLWKGHLYILLSKLYFRLINSRSFENFLEEQIIIKIAATFQEE